MTITDAVKEIIKIRGLEIFKNLKQFLAFLDDLSPECQKERRIIKNNFNEYILGLFVDDSRRINQRLYLLRSKLDDVGLTPDWIDFILESFGLALGWEAELQDLKLNSPMSTSVPKVQIQSQKQEAVSTNIQDVVLNDEVLRQLGYSNKLSITEIDVPATYKTYSGTLNRITKIGDGVFINCASLRTINLPETIDVIGKRAFANCKSLVNITLPKNLTKIDFGAFSCCESLVTMIIPDKVTKIEVELFVNCKSLENIVLPNSIVEICDSAFAGCKSLNSLIIPNNVTKIGNRAFANCKSLTSMIIPETVKEIGNEIFIGCEKLKNFNLPTRFTIFKNDVNRVCEVVAHENLGQIIKKVANFDNELEII